MPRPASTRALRCAAHASALDVPTAPHLAQALPDKVLEVCGPLAALQLGRVVPHNHEEQAEGCDVHARRLAAGQLQQAQAGGRGRVQGRCRVQGRPPALTY